VSDFSGVLQARHEGGNGLRVVQASNIESKIRGLHRFDRRGNDEICRSVVRRERSDSQKPHTDGIRSVGKAATQIRGSEFQDPLTSILSEGEEASPLLKAANRQRPYRGQGRHEKPWLRGSRSPHLNPLPGRGGISASDVQRSMFDIRYSLTIPSPSGRRPG